MGQPKTLLEDICNHAFSLGADELEVESDDGELLVFVHVGNTAISIAAFEGSSKDARELRKDLFAAGRRPVNAMVAGRPVKLQVKRSETFGDHAFRVKVMSAAPGERRFTAKQGQYLAFLHHYTKVHRRPPSESELQEYFRVSPPSVHNMVITLERNGLIERTPGEARSIRVLVPPDQLPPLE
jgi:hypothetical protein